MFIMELNISRTTRTTFLSLSNELLLLIFEDLFSYDNPEEWDPFESWHFAPDKTLPTLRLVCKRFQLLATPIRYRDLTIQCHHQIRARRPQPRSVRKKVAQDVARFTEHATVVGKVNWHHIIQNNDALPRLKTIKWKFHARSPTFFEGNIHAVPESILRPGVTISIAGTGYYHKFIYLVPPQHVSELFLGYWYPSNPYDIDAHDAIDLEYNPKFKDYIVRAKKLETLNYDLATVSSYLGGAAPSFPRLELGEKMPALKSLVLTGYHWTTTREEVKSSWDFSKLETLDITGMNHKEFITAVDTKWLCNLRSLRLGSFVWLGPNMRSGSPKRNLLHKFLRGIPQLEVLSMNAYTEDFPLDILMAMENLRVLEFTEDIAMFQEAGSPPRLDMKDLEELLQYLPRLERLHIDFETWEGDFKCKFLRMLSQFPALNCININNHGFNRDPSDDLDTFASLGSCASIRLVSLHHGHYVDAGVAATYNGGNRRWERYKSSHWIEPR